MTWQQWTYIMSHDFTLYLQKMILEVVLSEKYNVYMGPALNSFGAVGTENTA
jgi:hypothetical protein